MNLPFPYEYEPEPRAIFDRLYRAQSYMSGLTEHANSFVMLRAQLDGHLDRQLWKDCQRQLEEVEYCLNEVDDAILFCNSVVRIYPEINELEEWEDCHYYATWLHQYINRLSDSLDDQYAALKLEPGSSMDGAISTRVKPHKRADFRDQVEVGESEGFLLELWAILQNFEADLDQIVRTARKIAERFNNNRLNIMFNQGVIP